MARRVLVRAFVLTAFASLFAVSALAAEGDECFTYDATLPETEIPPEDGVYGTFPAPLFDPSLGGLTSVQIETDTDFAGTVGVENTNLTQGKTYNFVFTWHLALLREDDSVLLESSSSRNVFGFLDPFDGTIDFGGFSGQSFNLTRADILGDVTSTEAADLTWLTGVGTLDFPFHAWYDIALMGPGSEPLPADLVIAASDVSVSSALKITYCIPEPGSVLLLACAVPLLLRRR